jgi:hypothetical protein
VRYKERIEPLDLGLAEIEQLRPVSFQWKNSGAADLGFVAEEVAGIDPRLVTRDDEGRVEGVKYERMSAVLVGAVQQMLGTRARARRGVGGFAGRESRAPRGADGSCSSGSHRTCGEWFDCVRLGRRRVRCALS